MKAADNKKRNYASPQKTQISIVTYKNQKKINSNPTPPRTAIERSLKAITSQSITSPPKMGTLSNKPYHLLANTEVEPKETKNESPQDWDVFGPAHTPASIQGTTNLNDDSDSLSGTSLSSSEKTQLSRKAQQTLRKIRLHRRALLDDSVWAEVESVLGHDPLDNISPEGPQSYKEQSHVNDDITDDGKQSKDNKQTEDMLIDVAGKQDKTFASCATADQLSKSTPTSQEPEKNPESQAHLTRNVTFVATIMKTATNNSHSLCGGNVKGTYKPIPDNPYTKPRSSDSGVLYPQPTPQKVIKTDKAITLKKSVRIFTG
jgi:hypothetical protein